LGGSIARISAPESAGNIWHTHTRIYIYSVDMYICIYICTSVYLYIYISARIYKICMHVYMYICVYVYSIYVYVYVMYVCMYACMHGCMLRKPADRLGKVVFANEVSIGGVGGGRCPASPKSRYWVVVRVANWIFLGGHVPLGNLVTVGFDSP